MNERPTHRYRADVEPLEVKQPLTAAHTTIHPPPRPASPPALISTSAAPSDKVVSSLASSIKIHPAAKKPNFGYLVFRVTNPKGLYTLKPPFGHVLVQMAQPVPGQTYNILSVDVKNLTNQTFDASSPGFEVRLTNQRNFVPILTGNETWKPGQDYIFYVLTKKYYPLENQVSGGFQFILGGAPSVAIPGPSGIFLRIKYNPATINRILDYVVTKGPGAQGGVGIRYGLPDTQIYAFVSATEKRNDFGGYF